MIRKSTVLLLGICLILPASCSSSSSSSSASAPKADDGSSKSVASAYRVCQAIDKTGMASEPCVVRGWESIVEVHLDMDGANARSTCAGMVSMVHQQSLYFDPGWTIQIFSPYTGDHPIATCSL